VVHGGGSRVGSIEEAVNRVGFAEIVRLVGVATVAGMVDGSLNAYGIPAARMRESLLLHALAAETLAGYTAVDPRSAYAAGLLRGVGMMVLDRASRGRIAAAEKYDAGRFATYREWEQALFGLTGIEVSTMVLDEWRFPAEAISAVEHHLLGDPTASRGVFPALLNLAGAIVAAHGRALPGEERGWTLTSEKLALAGLEEAQWRAASAQAFGAFKAQQTML
jgi:HD-like signal output (HDOD) protein